jgi:hypothetical protein
MSNDPTRPGYEEVRALRPVLLEADDEKIRRILAVVDDVGDPAVNQALLDPLRHRLASLKPVRRPRFARLLFIPLDPLITLSADDWQPDQPTIPRSVLIPIARIVRDGLGSLAPAIDAIIANGQEDPARAIAEAGKALWPPAAEILAAAPTPAGWSETGLPPAMFRTLADSITAVLRRAQYLRRLSQDEEIGTVEADANALSDILRDIANESEVSGAMISRLILVRSPHAVPLLRRIVSAGRKYDEKIAMMKAIERGIEATIADMERETAFVDLITHGALSDVGREARRVEAVLGKIETDAASARHRPRLKAIRAKLDNICRERFARGVGECLVTRLSAATRPMDAPGHAELEACSRDLRRLDTSAPRVSAGSGGYDQLLTRAAEAVRVAAEAGTITPMRYYRLIELLTGPDAAEELYNKASAKR